MSTHSVTILLLGFSIDNYTYMLKVVRGLILNAEMWNSFCHWPGTCGRNVTTKLSGPRWTTSTGMCPSEQRTSAVM